MGKEKVVVVILEPAKEKGLATLKIGKNVLNYIPSIERTIKLPPSMMNESWMGSHFTNDDLVRGSSLERDYYSELVKEDSQRYYIELKPKPDSAVIWGKVEMEVEKGTYIPLKVHFYNEKGERVRRIIY
ncbi:MAG: outer membrane lipoprotein-sorting protein [Candidatus Aminicenantia bacterium]